MYTQIQLEKLSTATAVKQEIRYIQGKINQVKKDGCLDFWYYEKKEKQLNEARGKHPSLILDWQEEVKQLQDYLKKIGGADKRFIVFDVRAENEGLNAVMASFDHIAQTIEFIRKLCKEGLWTETDFQIYDRVEGIQIYIDEIENNE